ncbi:hypothetical protein CNR22_15335 [Sphingobacteriaceae bacterium]|nr:hypothetical protein CNR22_15335 [Sphingobacteriaceae bacterium]
MKETTEGREGKPCEIGTGRENSEKKSYLFTSPICFFMKTNHPAVLFLLILFCLKGAFAQTALRATPQEVDSLKSELLHSKTDTAKLTIRYWLGVKSLLLRTSYWDSLIADARYYHLPELERKALYSLGNACFYLGFYDKAFTYCNLSYKMAQQNKDTAGMFPPLLRLSRLFYVKNEIKKALAYSQMAIRLAQRKHDTLNLANAFHEESLCYFSWHDISKAMPLHLQCLKLYKKLKYERGIAESLLSLGSDYQILNMQTARNDYMMLKCGYYFACKKYTDLFGDDFISVDINNSIASAYQSIHHLDSALKYCSKAYKIALRTKSNLYIVRTMVTSISINYQIHKNHEALKTAEAALRIADSTGFTLQLLEIAGLSKLVYLSLGNYKRAFDMQQLYDELKDTLSNENYRKHILKKEFNYNLEKKENENRILELELRQNKYLLAGMLLLVVFILSTAYLLLHQNKLKSEQQNFHLEQKVLSLQMNPHFIFNSLQAIQSIVLKEDKKKAERYLGFFARVMRNVLENSRVETISLQKEIHLLDDYLRLQQLRFDHRFDYVIKTDETIDLENTFVAPMLAQPFIENAVEHGLRGIKSGGLISVAYTFKKDAVVLEITDNGTGIREYDTIKNHRSLAIDITQERIALMNKKTKVKAFFSIGEAFPESPGRKGVKVIFILPQMVQE